MKQLFLCSYFAGVKDLFRQYATEKQLGNQVLFIPTAGNVEEYRGYIDEALQTFEDLGFQVEVLDISACDRETAQAKIFQSKLLYISGGNTFYLLQELKRILKPDGTILLACEWSKLAYYLPDFTKQEKLESFLTALDLHLLNSQRNGQWILYQIVKN